MFAVAPMSYERPVGVPALSSAQPIFETSCTKEMTYSFPSSFMLIPTEATSLVVIKINSRPKDIFCIGRLMIIHTKIINVSWVLIMTCLEVSGRKPLS